MNIDWSPKLIVAYVFGFTVTVAVIFAFIAVEYGKSASGLNFSISTTQFLTLSAYAAFLLLCAISIGYAIAKVLEFFSEKKTSE